MFLTLDPSIRMDRLKERETGSCGSEFNEAAHREFFDWARGYDDAEFSGRSRARHERWLALLPMSLSFAWTARNRCRDYWTP